MIFFCLHGDLGGWGDFMAGVGVGLGVLVGFWGGRGRFGAERVVWGVGGG